MKTTVEKLSPTRVKLSISVTPEELKPSIDHAYSHIAESVEIITHMTHLGDVRSLILHPASTSHAGRTEAERAEAGVFPGTLRVSIGIEDIDDLLRDLGRAFDSLPASASQREVVVL